MTTTRTPRCRSQGGVLHCTSPNCPEKRAQVDAFFGIQAQGIKKPAKKRPAVSTQHPADGAQLDTHIYVHKEKQTDPDTTWQTVFLKNKAGVPAVFMKLRLGNRRSGNGTLLESGPVLCDIEINPVMRGQGVALAALRIIKQTHNAPQVWVGDTFSTTGYRMVQRLLEHERVTGEKTVQFHPWLQAEYIRPGYEDAYEFVKNWDTMTPMYDVV